MIRGITFDKQRMKSEDHAHQTNYFYQGRMGITKGCNVSVGSGNNIVISDGYFIIYGRLVRILGDTFVSVPSVASGTLFTSLVFEVDLSKENSEEEFNQGTFKLVSNASTYPALIQENLDNGGQVYQMEFCRFANTLSGITQFTDRRVILGANPETINATLQASNWTGTGPFTQVVTVPGATNLSTILFDLAMNVTTDQYNQGMDAMLKATAQGVNSVTVKAFGDKPTVSIPVQFVILS